MVKVFLTLGAIVSVSVAARFHTELKSSIPAASSSAPAPTFVSLTFTEAVRVAVSRIAILDADSALIEKVVIRERKDTTTIDGPIAKRLTPGKYLVSWRTMSDDGHAVKGFIPFTVVAGQ